MPRIRHAVHKAGPSGHMLYTQIMMLTILIALASLTTSLAACSDPPFVAAGGNPDWHDLKGPIPHFCEVPVPVERTVRRLGPPRSKTEAPWLEAIDNVSRDSLYRTIEDLQNFGTRYEFSQGQEDAAEYLAGRLAGLGYEPRFHDYRLSNWDVQGAAFQGDNAWMVLKQGGDNDSGAVLASTDGGETWTTDYLADFGLYAVSAPSPDHVWACGAGGRVLHRAAGTWSLRDTLGSERLEGIEFRDNANGFAAARRGTIYRTGDGGDSWSDTSITQSVLFDIAYPADSLAFACGSSGRIWKWNGANWALESTPTFLPVVDIDFNEAGTWGAAAISEGRVLIWDGSSWTGQNVDARFLSHVQASGDSTLWFGTRDDLLLTHVYSSGDRGATTQEITFPFGLLWRPVEALHTPPGGAVFIGGFEGFLVRRAGPAAPWTFPPLPPEVSHASRNVYADKVGAAKPGEMVILSGHYDSINQRRLSDPAPGADDDASGIAAALETARVLADYPTDRTVRFLFFSGEELGLLGSTVYARDARAGGDAVYADVQVDMIAYPLGEPLRVIANDASDWLLERAAPFVPDSTSAFSVALQVAPEQVYSDHASFWANGYPAVQISETIDIATNPLHTLGDTLGHLELDFAENAVKLIAALTHDLAGPFALAAPVLSAANDGLDVLLSWNEVPGATSYRIERNGVLIAEVAGSVREYRDTGACCGERNYTIAAESGALTSGAGTVTIVSIPESMKPYPNPSTGSTVFIPYQSASPSKIARLGSEVRVSIYSPSGRLVRELAADRQDAYRVGVLEWNGRDTGGESVAAGVYLIKIDNGDTEETRKITLVR